LTACPAERMGEGRAFAAVDRTVPPSSLALIDALLPPLPT
jgi:hypothetical protein